MENDSRSCFEFFADLSKESIFHETNCSSGYDVIFESIEFKILFEFVCVVGCKQKCFSVLLIEEL